MFFEDHILKSLQKSFHPLALSEPTQIKLGKEEVKKKLILIQHLPSINMVNW